MAGVMIERNDILEPFWKVLSTPGHDADGSLDRDEGFVTSANASFWLVPAANGFNVAGDVIPAAENSTTHLNFGAPRDGVDRRALNCASTSLRSKGNKISMFVASKSSAAGSACGLPQAGADTLAFDQGSTSRRSKANKISRHAQANSGSAGAAWGLPQERAERRAFDQGYSARRTNFNKIPRITPSNFGATDSVWGTLQDGDDSLALDQGPSLSLANVSQNPLHAASMSNSREVAAPMSPVIDVDMSEYQQGSNPHVQMLQSYQYYMESTNARYMGTSSMTLCSNTFSLTTSVPSLPTSQLHKTQRTTVVLRNIPKSYATSRVVKLLDSVGCKGMFDFVDVPTDRVSRWGKGYAIVNLIHPSYAPFFWKTFDGFTQWTCKSRNTCHVVWYEQLQGLHELIVHYKNLTEVREDIPKKARPWLLNEGVWL